MYFFFMYLRHYYINHKDKKHKSLLKMYYVSLNYITQPSTILDYIQNLYHTINKNTVK